MYFTSPEDQTVEQQEKHIFSTGTGNLTVTGDSLCETVVLNGEGNITLETSCNLRATLSGTGTLNLRCYGDLILHVIGGGNVVLDVDGHSDITHRGTGLVEGITRTYVKTGSGRINLRS